MGPSIKYVTYQFYLLLFFSSKQFWLIKISRERNGVVHILGVLHKIRYRKRISWEGTFWKAGFFIYCNFRCIDLYNRWVSVVEFHDRALSIGKVFGQESTVVKWNYQILSLHLVTVHQKVPILDFQSEFSTSKIIRIFLKKFSLKNINLSAPFL